MSRPFLITGLPRSRTAWLATACNTVAGSICYHEPLADYAAWRETLRLWSSPDHDFVGIADSSLGFHLEEIIAEIEPRILVVARPIEEVLASLDKLSVPRTRYCHVLQERLDRVRAHPLVDWVAFADLSLDMLVRSALWHLMPGARVERRKLTELRHMNIQTDPERTWRLARERDPVAALGAETVAALR